MFFTFYLFCHIMAIFWCVGFSCCQFSFDFRRIIHILFYNDALPASVSGKIENLNSSFYSRARSNANSSLGLRVLFALVVCIFTGCCFTYFSSFLTSDAHSNSSSHSIVLDYIHKQDGKK